MAIVTGGSRRRQRIAPRKTRIGVRAQKLRPPSGKRTTAFSPLSRVGKGSGLAVHIWRKIRRQR